MTKVPTIASGNPNTVHLGSCRDCDCGAKKAKEERCRRGCICDPKRRDRA